ncbi:hypothetical protein ABL78_1188 [Leptomonas seymouri]|uniref:Uncharacterized protein n=1 Tax=Leptomonas seymouri TaxID=5684 RepID=A0A0N1IM83_LEPSE|nr:hypothetical protein ABL78_1188 [Leptomonas seymouri]|eukprot:KPI89695.1 hypothetical protein ABL78_1188 [Leptomonas seymouri]
MLRRLSCARVVRTACTACSSPPPFPGAPSRYLTATLPLLSTAHRPFSSHSDNETKKNGTVTAKQDTATAAATAAQVFATNEKGKVSTTAAGSEDSVGSDAQEHPQREDAVPAALPSTSVSGIRTIGIKLSEDDELVRAFNNFSHSVNGCTQEEFLVGVKQAYASLAVVISALVEKAQQPPVGLTESSKIIAAAHEAVKLLDHEFKPETRVSAPATKPTVDAPDAASPHASGGAGTASPKAKLQDTLVQHVVSTIASIIPVSRHLAESIFKIWMLQKEKQVNLSSIASPADYVLDSKLVIFARLDKPRIYFNSDSIGAEVDVTLNNEYLRKLDPSTAGARPRPASANDDGSPTAADGVSSKAQANNADDDDIEEGMIHVLTDTAANAQRVKAEEHTFVVNKQTRTLTPAFSSANAKAEDAPAATAATTEPPSPSGKAASKGKSAPLSRVQVTCAKPSENSAEKATTADTASTASLASDSKAECGAAGGKEETAADPDACSVFIKVNGNALPPIPADARACALLSVDVVVPPERYAYNFEWFYKRIVGYENEYEHIAAARVFASNSPKPLGTFLDFVMRMLTGKSVEFMFSKSIGRMIGIPEDVSETPPATRKLMCMYMDASYRWVLADLVTLAPVIETKLPKA